jgi:hypothetical protein
MFCGRRYGWVLQLPVPTRGELQAMSSTAKVGWNLAEVIATTDQRRREEALRGITPPALELAWLARDFNLEPEELLEALSQFRIEYFGADLSDSAIYYRLKRKRKVAHTCAQENCDAPLPQAAPTNRRYCEQHRTAAARTRRHRASTASPRGG